MAHSEKIGSHSQSHAQAKTKTASGTIAENRRARFDYETKEIIEAGIQLRGYEVKSAKDGAMQIAGAHVLIRGGEAWLVNMNIPAYQPKNTPGDYEADRARRLLLSRDQLNTLTDQLKDKSLHLIPLRAYIAHGLIKIELGLGHSRKKSDKREVLKKRSHMREMRER